MPVKIDESGKHLVEMELIAPGTPKEVWHAMATGPGYTAWFTKTLIEERVGGSVQFDFGPNGSSTGEVTIWEPPYRFGYVEYEWSEGAPPCVTTITISSRPDGRCNVRMIHSLETAQNDWDESLESFESGWSGFFEVLKLYLAHFAGKPAASFLVLAKLETSQAEVWKQLTEALNLAAPNVGEERITPEHPERLSGVVERVQQSSGERYILLRLTEPEPSIALIGAYGMGNTANASMTLYHYGVDAEQRAIASQAKWQQWFSEFPSKPV